MGTSGRNQEGFITGLSPRDGLPEQCYDMITLDLPWLCDFVDLQACSVPLI